MDIFPLLSLSLYSLRPPLSLPFLYEASYSLPVPRTSCGSQLMVARRPHHVVTAFATDHAPGYGAAAARDYQDLGWLAQLLTLLLPPHHCSRAVIATSRQCLWSLTASATHIVSEKAIGPPVALQVLMSLGRTHAVRTTTLVAPTAATLRQAMPSVNIPPNHAGPIPDNATLFYHFPGEGGFENGARFVLHPRENQGPSSQRDLVLDSSGNWQLHGTPLAQSPPEARWHFRITEERGGNIMALKTPARCWTRVLSVPFWQGGVATLFEIPSGFKVEFAFLPGILPGVPITTELAQRMARAGRGAWEGF